MRLFYKLGGNLKFIEKMIVDLHDLGHPLVDVIFVEEKDLLFGSIFDCTHYYSTK